MHRIQQIQNHVILIPPSLMLEPSTVLRTIPTSKQLTTNAITIDSANEDNSKEDVKLSFETITIERERQRASFPIRDLTCYLEGGEDHVEMRESIAELLEANEIFHDEYRQDLPRDEQRKRVMGRIFECVRIIRSQSTSAPIERTSKVASDKPSRAGVGRAYEDKFYSLLGSYDPSWSIRMGVHYGLFASAIESSGTEEQRKHWTPLIRDMRIVGCFCMTELGHGSNVQKLETTATYDKSTRTFNLNTPTLTATKWWIGMAAHSATHGVVFARLKIDEADFGIHSFIVPLRDINSGKILEGVEIGDMGTKLGRDGIDNGYIQFKNVSIPYDNMLMRWSYIDSNGKYVSKTSRKGTNYLALLQTRLELFRSVSDTLMKSITIAIRYSAVRRQSGEKIVKYMAVTRLKHPLANVPEAENTGNGELQLLDYPTHQYRLFPILTSTFAYYFTSNYIAEVLLKNTSDFENQPLDHLHATTSALKCFATWYTNDSIETCRQSLGGVGYSAYTNLGSLRNDFAVMCTFEGDNTILALQCGNFLIKYCKKGISNDASSNDSFRYIHSQSLTRRWNIKNEMDICSSEMTALQNWVGLFQYRAQQMIHSTTKKVDEYCRKQQCAMEIALHFHAIDLVHLARAHCDAFVIQCFLTQITSAPVNLQPTLKTLFVFHCCVKLEEKLNDWLELNFCSIAQISCLRASIQKLMATIRNDAVALVDAFNLSDFILSSPCGRYDGNIYTSLFKTVQNAPGSTNMPDYYKDYILPLTTTDTLTAIES